MGTGDAQPIRKVAEHPSTTRRRYTGPTEFWRAVMSSTVIGLALFSAILHATWNAVLRSGADRLWSVTTMSFATTIIAIPFALALPLPSPPCWPYLILSSCLQVGYSVFLVYAYRHGDLGQVYPVVRGSVPLLVTLGVFLLTGQRPGTFSAIGVILVALGIMGLALSSHRASLKSVGFALLTGVFIASYTVTDATGVRLAGNPGIYTTWILPDLWCSHADDVSRISRKVLAGYSLTGDFEGANRRCHFTSRIRSDNYRTHTRPGRTYFGIA